LRLLAVFETVLRCGSVREAAVEMNVSQPAVSQSLRQLEDHVGTPLLDRARRPATRTAAGRILETAALEGLGRISDAIAQIRRLHIVDESAVTVACSVGFATYWLMPRLADFYGRHPEIAVNVRTTLHGAPRLADGVNIAVRYGGGKWTDGNVIKLFDEQVTPVLTPQLKQKLETENTGLDRAVLLHVNSEDADWVTWRDYFDAHAIKTPPPRGRHFTNYVQATQAALDGQGILLGWRSITGDLVKHGRLVAFNDKALAPAHAYYAVAGAGVGGSSDALLDWLRGRAEELVPPDTQMTRPVFLAKSLTHQTEF
jgi:LysR family transcriptional regulator, glycine cleavage system transcriptional activator